MHVNVNKSDRSSGIWKENSKFINVYLSKYKSFNRVKFIIVRYFSYFVNFMNFQRFPVLKECLFFSFLFF